MTTVAPVAPLMLVGPEAVRVQAVATAVPPWSLVTVLVSVRIGTIGIGVGRGVVTGAIGRAGGIAAAAGIGHASRKGDVAVLVTVVCANAGKHARASKAEASDRASLRRKPDALQLDVSATRIP